MSNKSVKYNRDLSKDRAKVADTYEAIFENTDQSIILLAPDFKVLHLNKVAKERTLNNSGKHIHIGADFRDFIYPGDDVATTFFEIFELALAGKSETREVNVKKDYGQSFWIRSKTAPVYDKNRLITGVTLITESIDETKNNQLEILKLNRLYQLTSQINEAIIKLDTQEEILTEACRIAVEVGGFRMSWIGLYDNKTDIVTPFTWSGHVQGFFDRVELKEIRITSSEIPLAQIINSKTAKYINDIENAPEIPEQIKKELLQRNYRSFVGLPIIIDTVVVGVFAMFMPQNFFFNDEEVKLLKDVTDNIAYSLDKIRIRELHSKTEANLTSVFDNTDVGFLLLDKHFNIIDFNSTYEESYLKVFGTRLSRSVNYVSVTQPERRSELKKILNKVLKENTPAKFDIKYETQTGTYFYFIRIIPVHNKRNEVIGLCTSSTDITERKVLEIKQDRTLKDLIKRNQDLEKFSYIVSHNLRAPISRILGLNELLSQTQEEPDKDFIIKSIDTSVKDLDQVITDMNEVLYIRNEISEVKTMVDLKSIVQEIKESLKNRIERTNATIEYDFDSAMEIYGIRSYIYNIFYQLISNSIKYSRPGIPPHLWISSQRSNETITLRLLDNGLGIDLTKYENQVFGLYKRFHPEIEGKGMGLYMVKTQVEILGGTIEVISAPDEGTEFIISFELETS